MAESKRQTEDMLRAKDAWDNVQEIVKKSKDERKKYASRAKDIGALIMTAGLGPALAFLRSKSSDKNPMPQTLYEQISKWVTGRLEGEGKSSVYLLQLVMDNDTAYYRRATTEALAYSVWLKRFVEAEFKKELEEGEVE